MFPYFDDLGLTPDRREVDERTSEKVRPGSPGLNTVLSTLGSDKTSAAF